MSLVGTLAKVVVGVVVAKGLGNALNGAKDRHETPSRGGSAGHGTPYGRSDPSSHGSSPNGGLGDMLGQVLGRQGPRNRGSLGAGLEELSDLSRPGGASHPGSTGSDHRFDPPRPGSLGDALDQSLRRYGEPETRPSERDDVMAGLLLRALIQAAKSDGRIDRVEKEQLLEKLGDLEPGDIEFVNRELAKPIDVAGLARDVPRGAEAQVYMMSLMGIDLDTRQEGRYLHDLARALGLSTSTVNDIHDRLGEPRIIR